MVINSKSIRVLIVDKNDSRASALMDIMASARVTTVTRTEIEHPTLLPILQSQYDVILLVIDHNAELVREWYSHVPNIPIIAVVENEQAALAIQTVRAGAQDCLPRDSLRGEWLVRSIRYAIERHRLREELRAMSLTDELTGLYNRRGFTVLAEQELKLAHRLRRKMVLFFVDLDGLKKINDLCGHSAGDTALQNVARILKNTFRSSDLIARVGGDEFVVLAMEGNKSDNYLSRLDKHIQVVNSKQDLGYILSLSIGTAYYDPRSPISLDQLMIQADVAMYQDKQKTDANPTIL